ncbi:MAG: cupin domain-containing protein [Panacagrimonas sp.]
MDAKQFQAELERDGFGPAIAGEYAPGLINPDHTHPFEVRGLIVRGEMIISCGGEVQNCGPGDVFVMRLGELHREEVGRVGVVYLYASRAATAGDTQQ